MYLALRKGPLVGSKWYEKIGAKVIEYKLKTKWPHAGIVVGNHLYHSTANGGLKKELFVSNGQWDLFWCGNSRDTEVIAQFEKRLADGNGKVRYDWFSLLAFTPVKLLAGIFKSEVRYHKWLYCYEWCYEVMTQKRVTTMITPEDLLEVYIEKYGDKNARI